MSDNLKFTQEANLVAFGQKGFDFIEATNTYNTQKYAVIDAYDQLTINYTNDADGTTGTITIPAGKPLFGLFSSVEVTAGNGVAYLAKTRV